MLEDMADMAGDMALMDAGEEKTLKHLTLQPIEELGEEKKKLTKSLTAESMMKTPSLCNYQLQRYLKESGRQGICKFLEVTHEWNLFSHKKKSTSAKGIFESFLKSDGCGPLPGQVETNEEGGENTGKASDNIGAWISTQDAAVVQFVSEKVNQAEVEDTVWDPVLKCIEKFCGDIKNDFVASEHFDRYVQLIKYGEKEITYESFSPFRVLGKGAFGAVNAAQKSDTSDMYAVKQMDKRMIKNNKSEDIVTTEKTVLSMMESPFVLSLDFAFHDKNKCYVVFEMLGGGDLSYHLSRVGEKAADKLSRFPVDQSRFHTAEIILGIEHMHSKNIVYRDLKPANILLRKSGHVVISDLGLAVVLKPDEKLRQCAGTPKFWPPEIMKKETTHTCSDWWTLGVVLHRMLTGKYPSKCKCNYDQKEWCTFCTSKQGSKNAREKDGVYKGEMPMDSPHLDEEAKDLLRKLLNPNPKKRLGYGPGAEGTDDIKNHPWFKSINWDQLSKGELEPPFLPPDWVNAEKASQVGEFDVNEKIKITDEDNAHYKDFYFVNTTALEKGMVEYLEILDNADPNDARFEKKGGGCCSLM